MQVSSRSGILRKEAEIRIGTAVSTVISGWSACRTARLQSVQSRIRGSITSSRRIHCMSQLNMFVLQWMEISTPSSPVPAVSSLPVYIYNDYYMKKKLARLLHQREYKLFAAAEQ